MRKKIHIIFIICTLFLIGCNSYGQSIDSAYTQLVLPQRPSPQQIEEITLATKVWGFAKYHHPVFSKKGVNADAHYFILLNRILNAKDSSTNQVLYSWIESLGNFESTSYPIKKQHLVINEMAWITDTSLLGTELSKKLIALKSAKRTKNQYIKQTSVNLTFNEPEYKEIAENDIAYRLLGVAKFWNCIDSYSPNRNITDNDWEEVLPLYIERAFDTTIAYPHLYATMATELNDSHANAWNDISLFLGRNIIPIVVQFAENRMFVCDTCTLAPNELNIGDEIVTIDGVKPIEKLKDIAKYNSHSNSAVLIRDASYQALLTPHKEVKIVYRRQGVEKEITLPCVASYQFNKYINNFKSPIGDKPFGKIDKGVAYINIGALKAQDGEKMYKFIKRYKYLIIDIRTYPADYAVLHNLLPNYFFDAKRHVGTQVLPLAKRPGCCRRNEIYTSITNNQDKLYKGKIALLVDANTQSMAEYFTMFMQTVPNAITIGSCTAGADGDITHISVPYRPKGIFFTGAGILYPDGTNAQRNGVKIDYEVKPTAESMQKGEDKVLKEAIQILKNQSQQ